MEGLGVPVSCSGVPSGGTTDKLDFSSVGSKLAPWCFEGGLCVRIGMRTHIRPTSRRIFRSLKYTYKRGLTLEVSEFSGRGLSTEPRNKHFHSGLMEQRTLSTHNSLPTSRCSAFFLYAASDILTAVSEEPH